MTHPTPQSPYYGPPATSQPNLRAEDYWMPVAPEELLPPVNPYTAPGLVYTMPPTKRDRGLWIGLAGICVLVLAAVAAALVAVEVTRHHNASAGTLKPATPDTATTGVVFESKTGHFTARFPAQPKAITVPMSIGSVKIAENMAVSSTPLAEVGEDTTSQATSSADYLVDLQIQLRAFAAPGDLRIDSEADSTFRGLPAEVATYTTPTGDVLNAVAFYYSGTRSYVLVGEAGSTFDELTASFVATP